MCNDGGNRQILKSLCVICIFPVGLAFAITGIIYACAIRDFNKLVEINDCRVDKLAYRDDKQLYTYTVYYVYENTPIVDECLTPRIVNQTSTCYYDPLYHNRYRIFNDHLRTNLDKSQLYPTHTFSSLIAIGCIFGLCCVIFIVCAMTICFIEVYGCLNNTFDNANVVPNHIYDEENIRNTETQSLDRTYIHDIPPNIRTNNDRHQCKIATVESQCVICMNCTPNCLLPCGHICMCVQCEDQLLTKICPNCRKLYVSNEVKPVFYNN